MLAENLGRTVQRHRINILRLLFLSIVPLLLFTRSAWNGDLYPLFHEVREVLGTLLVIAGVLGRFWAILYAGGRKNVEVVQSGPYSMCRHPLYLFSTIAVTGFGVLLGSAILTILLGTVTYAVLRMTAAREEAHLREAFGPAYDLYAARVPAIIPDPALFHSPPEWTFEVSQLRRNFRDALVFLTFIPLAELMEYLHETGAVVSIPIY